MSLVSDLIKKQVTSNAKGVDIPANIKDKVLGGLSDSILGGLTQTASKPGGIDIITNLLTGKANAASSPVTKLATSLFANNVLKKFGLGQSTGSVLSGMIPTILTSLTGALKDQDGDGDVDLNDIIISLTGGNNGGSSVVGAAKSIIGGILGKK